MLRKILSLTIATGLVLTLVSSNHAVAQTGQGVGITVSPVVDNVSINPGQTVNRLVKITNPTSSTLTLYPITLNFTTDNKEGKPVFYSDTQRSSRYSLSSWVKPDVTSLTVAPLQFTVLGYSITAPTDAEPGGHYGSILLSTEPPKTDDNNGSQVSVVGLVGTLLLVNVPGDVVVSGSITSLDAPTLLFKAPANFVSTITNTGNTHFRPIGDIKIKNWSGAIATDLTVNDVQGAVLPDSQRQFTNSWGFDWKTFGRYTATLTLVYGSPEQRISETRIFYVIPYWLLILMAALLLIIIYFIVRHKRKKHKQETHTATAAKTHHHHHRRPTIR